MAEAKKLVAMVAGGAGSLGLATVKKLLTIGYKVVLFDLPAADKLVKKHFEEEKNVTFVPGDITSEEDVKKAMDSIDNTNGEKFDLLVNCAGLSQCHQTFNFNKNSCASLEDFKNMMNVNVSGTFNTVRYAAQKMFLNDADEDGLRGLVINTSGFFAYDGQIGQVGLAAVGGAVASMTLPLCREFSPIGVRVMSIAPGVMDSNLTCHLPKNINEHLGLCTPNPKRMGFPNEYAELVVSIINNKFLNGSTIRLDGGLRMYLM
ncbi:3-hydroxyacyl-CoA dehydrogenase, putative [Pediculus humanus corporis]|uniref:3-hydroxyacyl-CoA dehydrogenase, putative n=1 Tax=Pediculus humanus subsp. corporis TaxID=121224 RepID=E0VWN1_PEDHC|nr:3-hydroxyacyl-CoA dehydrogenase, putative [Pediculus humanus corporis]EEB17787.1 3-hydroxyacyl-CoA dehydrogenase, putative [Pediculus humanus corporis]